MSFLSPESHDPETFVSVLDMTCFRNVQALMTVPRYDAVDCSRELKNGIENQGIRYVNTS